VWLKNPAGSFNGTSDTCTSPTLVAGTGESPGGAGGALGTGSDGGYNGGSGVESARGVNGKAGKAGKVVKNGTTSDYSACI
jgi:hypothetical protein